MNIPLLAANILCLIAFIIHTFVGDNELHILEPNSLSGETTDKREKWTMARGGWHWVSLDLLFATLGIGLINFSSIIANEKQLLHILSFYFLGYGVIWLGVIMISKSFPKNYLKLGQWLLLWLMSALLYWGAQ